MKLAEITLLQLSRVCFDQIKKANDFSLTSKPKK